MSGQLAAVDEILARGAAVLLGSSLGGYLATLAAARNPDRVRGLVARGIPVLAYGSHVRADLLRAARDAGATAVPNSEVERRLVQLLTST